MEQVIHFRAEPSQGASEFVVERVIPATPEVVWQVLAEIGDIADWNRGVTRSYVSDDAPIAAGSTRTCELGPRHFLEEQVVRFEPGRALTMRITKSSLPFAGADIRFLLTRTDEGGTRVTVSPTYTLKYGLIGRLLDVLFFRRTYRRGMGVLLKGLEAAAIRRGQQPAGENTLPGLRPPSRQGAAERD